MNTYLVHVDMDAFFAAIEQRDKPVLQGKPVVIGADPKQGKGRGVVSTCSYEARRFGICSAMPISTAYRLCPDAVFLPVAMEKYIEVSHQIYEIFFAFTPLVEKVSIDEAFLDIGGSFHLFGGPLATCKALKEKIYEQTGLRASVGLAPTRMTAKIASELQKPDGLVEVKEHEILDFLKPLAINKLWGVGKKTMDVFFSMGIRTIGDLASTDPAHLAERFGKNGEYFWQLAQGQGARRLDLEETIKSVSNEITFEKDTDDHERVRAALMQLCEKVSYRLRQEELIAKTITLKLRLTGFRTYTRSKTLTTGTCFSDIFYTVVERLYRTFDRKSRGVRLVGVKASGLLAAARADNLFSGGIKQQNQKRIHRAIDTVNKKYGLRTLHRAQGL